MKNIHSNESKISYDICFAKLKKLLSKYIYIKYLLELKIRNDSYFFVISDFIFDLI